MSGGGMFGSCSVQSSTQFHQGAAGAGPRQQDQRQGHSREQGISVRRVSRRRLCGGKGSLLSGRMSGDRYHIVDRNALSSAGAYAGRAGLVKIDLLGALWHIRAPGAGEHIRSSAGEPRGQTRQRARGSYKSSNSARTGHRAGQPGENMGCSSQVARFRAHWPVHAEAARQLRFKRPRRRHGRPHQDKRSPIPLSHSGL